MTEEAVMSDDVTKVIQEQENKFNQLLNVIGLQTPLDYIFLDFAIQKSRLNLKDISSSPHFLFHTISRRDLTSEDRPFPHCLFIEKTTYKKFDEEHSSSVDVTEGIVWSLAPSDIWNTRDILPFTDFHLYFTDILKPLYGYSAEDLYRIFDEKKEETFFITHGNRESTEQKRIVTLFCTPKQLVVFHFDEVNSEFLSKQEKFSSKWISQDLLLNLVTLHEFAVFERAQFQLVSKEPEENPSVIKPEKKLHFSTPGLDTVEDDDCMNCSA